jgi:hypothetical protein
LPIMLESVDYKSSLDGLLLIIASGLVLCSWNLYKAKAITDNPHKHPICKYLTQYGDVDLVVSNIENEIRDLYHSQELEDNTLFVTPS